MLGGEPTTSERSSAKSGIAYIVSPDWTALSSVWSPRLVGQMAPYAPDVRPTFLMRGHDWRSGARVLGVGVPSAPGWRALPRPFAERADGSSLRCVHLPAGFVATVPGSLRPFSSRCRLLQLTKRWLALPPRLIGSEGASGCHSYGDSHEGVAGIGFRFYSAWNMRLYFKEFSSWI